MRLIRRRLGSLIAVVALCGCAPAPPPAPVPAEARSRATPRWANRIWRVVAPPGRAPGSIYVFLDDGTLLMTSCVETYRLATWKIEADGRIAITEDDATAYAADIREEGDRRLDLTLRLVSEVVPLQLEAAPVPSVCPDLRRSPR